eukprot:430007_1
MSWTDLWWLADFTEMTPVVNESTLKLVALSLSVSSISEVLKGSPHTDFPVVRAKGSINDIDFDGTRDDGEAHKFEHDIHGPGSFCIISDRIDTSPPCDQPVEEWPVFGTASNIDSG